MMTTDVSASAIIFSTIVSYANHKYDSNKPRHGVATTFCCNGKQCKDR